MRGYPVEGLLCGCSSQPAPESGDGSVFAQLTLADDQGDSVAVRIALTVIRLAATRSKSLSRPAAGSLGKVGEPASDVA